MYVDPAQHSGDLGVLPVHVTAQTVAQVPSLIEPLHEHLGLPSKQPDF